MAAKRPPGFPLFLHGSKQWAKKVGGKLWYFGTDRDAALEKWLAEKDDLLAGRGRRVRGDGVILVDAVNRFLTNRESRVESGELTQRSWLDYRDLCAIVLDVLGRKAVLADLHSEDFEKLRGAMVRRKWGPAKLRVEITRARTLFNYAAEAYDIRIRMGKQFRGPSQRVMNVHRQKGGPKIFEAADIRRMLDKASVQMKAMIYLGLGAGLGNADIGMLEQRHVQGEWLVFPRPKTGANRKAWLWPETRAAIKAARAARPTAATPDLENRIFLTRFGMSWHRTETVSNSLSIGFRQLLVDLKLHNHGNGFYTLRRMCETIGGGTGDQIAIDLVMGHVSAGMGTTYRQGVEDARVKAVCSHVRAWLFKGSKAKAK